MQIESLIRLELLGFLCALCFIVAFKILTRRINVAGLFSRKGGSGSTSPERIQLLMATIVMSAKYVTSVAQSKSSGALPDVDAQWLYVFGGSSAIYASGKALTFFRNARNGWEGKR